MGMRASIGYIFNSEAVKLTSTQWSVRMDQTLGHYLSEARKSGEDVQNAAQTFFRAIIDYSHVSAVQIGNSEYGENKEIGNGVVINSPHGRNKQVFRNEEVSTDGSMRTYYDINDGAVGVVYDERKPEQVEFFWIDPDTNEMKRRNCGLEALANFYSDYENKPNKLKKFSFRN